MKIKLSGLGHRLRSKIAVTLSSSGLWLEGHKVWFETMAAVLLSVASILVSVLQLRASARQNAISDKQSDLLAIQTEVAMAENQRQEREEALSKQSAWHEFRDLCHLIQKELKSLPRDPGAKPGDFESLSEKMSADEMAAWLDRIVPLWTKLGSNRLIIEDSDYFNLYMKCVDDVETWGNFHNLFWPSSTRSQMIKELFPGVVSRMSVSISTLSGACSYPPLEPQNEWYDELQKQLIKDGAIIVNPDGTTTIPGKGSE